MAYRFCELARLGQGEGQRALGLLLAIVFWATPTRGASGAEPAEAFRGARAPSVVDPLVWQEVNHLTGEPNAYDEASYSVAMSGDTVVVGCFHEQFSHQVGFDTKGKVFVFTRKGAHQPLEPEWQHEATLEAAGGNPHAKLRERRSPSAAIPPSSATGRAHSISTRPVSVWGPPTSGAAAARRGRSQQRIQASDPSSGALFGYSVAISGATAVVGAPFWDPTFINTQSKGKAYVFVGNGGAWTEEKQLVADDGVREDNFGVSVAVSGDTVIVGAPYHDVVTPGGTNEDQGEAYAFVRTDGVWSSPAHLTASNGLPFDNFGFSVGVGRTTAVVGADGINSAYVFDRTGSSWNEQQVLAADDGPSAGFLRLVRRHLQRHDRRRSAERKHPARSNHHPASGRSVRLQPSERGVEAATKADCERRSRE